MGTFDWGSAAKVGGSLIGSLLGSKQKNKDNNANVAAQAARTTPQTTALGTVRKTDGVDLGPIDKARVAGVGQSQDIANTGFTEFQNRYDPTSRNSLQRNRDIVSGDNASVVKNIYEPFLDKAAGRAQRLGGNSTSTNPMILEALINQFEGRGLIGGEQKAIDAQRAGTLGIANQQVGVNNQTIPTLPTPLNSDPNFLNATAPRAQDQTSILSVLGSGVGEVGNFMLDRQNRAKEDTYRQQILDILRRQQGNQNNTYTAPANYASVVDSLQNPWGTA